MLMMIIRFIHMLCTSIIYIITFYNVSITEIHDTTPNNTHKQNTNKTPSAEYIIHKHKKRIRLFILKKNQIKS